MAARISVIGDGASIVIEGTGHERPPGSDRWDANWLTCSVELCIGGFAGQYHATFLTWEFAHFPDALKPVLESSCGTASFDTLEQALCFQVALRATGRALATGKARVRANTSAELAFSFETDQTFLVESLKALESVVLEFHDRR